MTRPPRRKRKRSGRSTGSGEDVDSCSTKCSTELLEISTGQTSTLPHFGVSSFLAPLDLCLSDTEDNSSIATIRWQYQLPTVYQPSLAEIFETAFVSHFGELHKGLRPFPDPNM